MIMNTFKYCKLLEFFKSVIATVAKTAFFLAAQQWFKGLAGIFEGDSQNCYDDGQEWEEAWWEEVSD